MEIALLGVAEDAGCEAGEVIWSLGEETGYAGEMDDVCSYI